MVCTPPWGLGERKVLVLSELVRSRRFFVVFLCWDRAALDANRMGDRQVYAVRVGFHDAMPITLLVCWNFVEDGG